MRILNDRGWEYATGPTIEKDEQLKLGYDYMMGEIANMYDELIGAGATKSTKDQYAAIEDARGILPTNILTNIMATGNLRTVIDLIKKRSSPRTQGEYRDVLEAMKAEILRVHPWVSLFIDRTADRAAKELDDLIMQLPDQDQRIRMIKLVDQMRQGA